MRDARQNPKHDEAGDDDAAERAKAALEQLRILSCDLAEHFVERLGKARGFAVWSVDGDVQSFTRRAQEAFDRISPQIERALLRWRDAADDAGRDDDVTDALAPLLEECGADAAVVTRVLARL